MDLAKRCGKRKLYSNGEKSKWGYEGHTAVVALLEKAMQQVSHGRSVVIVPTKHHQRVTTDLTLARRATPDHRPLTTTT